mmetsp:Transcript_48459/g.55750  ORF Transcript_48459/g.55750 Transcript_48459/m.55750 type:complete len:213 (+) Transcript_48459:57-695(+)
MADDLNFNIQVEDDAPQKKTGISSGNNGGDARNVAVSNQSVPGEGREGEGHPTARMFHVGFKIGALILYLMLNFVIDNTIIAFVFVTLLNAFDFWTVKNVTGRLLVGLRWWSHIQEDGSEIWYFESFDEKIKNNSTDSTVFWGALYLTPLLWFGLLIIAFLKFNYIWLVVCLIALVLSCSNVIGFYRCSKDHKKKVKGFLASQGLKAMTGGF